MKRTKCRTLCHVLAARRSAARRALSPFPRSGHFVRARLPVCYQPGNMHSTYMETRRTLHTSPLRQQWHPPTPTTSTNAPAAEDTIRVCPSGDVGERSSSIPLPTAPFKDTTQRMNAFQNEKLEEDEVEKSFKDEWTEMEAELGISNGDAATAFAEDEADLTTTGAATEGEKDGTAMEETDTGASGVVDPWEAYVDPPYRQPSLPSSDWLDTLAWRGNSGCTQSIEHLLFHLCPAAATAINTYMVPVDRVEFRTPLYDWHAKEALFYKTHWLEEMTRFYLTGRVTVEKEPAEAKPPAPPAPADSLVEASPDPNQLDANSLSVAPPPPPPLPPAPLPVAPPPPPPPPTHQNIVGRPKVMRYLFFQFLKKQHLWMDSVSEVLQRCAQEVAQGAEVPPAVTTVSSHFLNYHINQIIFSSPRMLSKLHAVITKPSNHFLKNSSTTDVWDLFVLHHRHNATLLPSPQRPPFSFGELRPTLAPSDFGRLRYGRSSDETVEEHVPEREKKEQPDKISLSSVEEKRWNTLPLYMQNGLLFSWKGARVAQDVTYANTSGIYTVFDIDPIDANEDALNDGADVNPKEDGKTTQELSENEQIRRHKQEDEQRRLGSYDVDRFYLGLIEPILHRVAGPSGEGQEQLTVHLPLHPDSVNEGKKKKNSNKTPAMTTNARQVPEEAHLYRFFAAADKQARPKTRYTKTGKARKQKMKSQPVLNHVYYSDGHFCNAHNGEVEDAQLSQLWQSFQNTDTSALLDLYVHQVERLDELRGTVAAELATQYAFLLLFFARDEVRAITSPKQTYYRLSFFHNALRDVMRTVLTLEGVAVGSASDTANPVPFEKLSPQSQCSFSFFGAAHIPPISSHATTTGKAPPTPVACARAPWDLYDQLLDVYPPTTPSSPEKVPEFLHLLPLQHFAVSFCYAQNEQELNEENWFKARNDPETQAALQAQLNSVVFMVPKMIDTRAATLEAVQRQLQMTIRHLKRHKRLPSHVGVLVKRKRGRPRKYPLPSPPLGEAEEMDEATAERDVHYTASPAVETPSEEGPAVSHVAPVVVKRKRGRPRKIGKPTAKTAIKRAARKSEASRLDVTAREPADGAVKRKRGRPRKYPKPEEDQEEVQRVVTTSLAGKQRKSSEKKRRGRPPLQKNKIERKSKDIADDAELITAVVRVIQQMRSGGKLPSALASLLMTPKGRKKKPSGKGKKK